MSSDLNRPPEQIVVDMINRDNGTHLVAEKLRFGIPNVITGRRNTRIVATARPYSGMVGSVTLEYNRIDLGVVPGVHSRIFYTNKPVLKLSDLIPEINARYNINLTKNDYIDAVLITPPVDDPELDIPVQAAMKSLVYTGIMVLQLADESRSGDIDLSSILKNLYLNGFTYEFLTTVSA